MTLATVEPLVVPLAKAIPAAMSAAVPAVPALRVKLLSATAQAPVRGSPLAAGYDLFCSQTTTIPARGRAIVPTDIAIACPPGHYARIAPRSGLAVKKGLDVGAGVVDEDYRGKVGVVMFNFSDDDHTFAVGDRCAQMILEKIATPPVAVVDDLDATERGAGGFGSTGGFTESAEPALKLPRTN